jgi:hypothetical protein
MTPWWYVEIIGVKKLLAHHGRFEIDIRALLCGIQDKKNWMKRRT